MQQQRQDHIAEAVGMRQRDDGKIRHIRAEVHRADDTVGIRDDLRVVEKNRAWNAAGTGSVFDESRPGGRRALEHRVGRVALHGDHRHAVAPGPQDIDEEPLVSAASDHRTIGFGRGFHGGRQSGEGRHAIAIQNGGAVGGTPCGFQPAEIEHLTRRMRLPSYLRAS